MKANSQNIMPLVQVYSNMSVFSAIFVYIIAPTFICAIGGHIYLYIDTYIRNINNKISFLGKMITAHSDKIKNGNKRIEQLESQFKKLTEKNELHGQYMSGMSKEINGYNNRIELLERELHNIYIYS